MQAPPLTRAEIRAKVRSHLGMVSSEAQAAQTSAQVNAYIDSAALYCHSKCRWVSANERTTVSIGAQQTAVAYPTNCYAGGVMNIGIARNDPADHYRNLQRMPIPVWLDRDRELAAGGNTASEVSGPPTRWADRAGQIQIWPPADEVYSLRIDWINTAGLSGNDLATPLIDSELMVLHTAHLFLLALGDLARAKRYEQMVEQRLYMLRSWQSNLASTPRDNSAAFHDVDGALMYPNYDRRPRTF